MPGAPSYDLPNNDEFMNVWRALTFISRGNVEHTPAKSLSTQQKILVDLIGSEHFNSPAQTLVYLMYFIERNAQMVLAQAHYRVNEALGTLEILLNTVPQHVRHTAWAEGGAYVFSADRDVFEHLSSQIMKEKLLSQHSVANGLNQTPAQSKM